MSPAQACLLQQPVLAHHEGQSLAQETTKPDPRSFQSTLQGEPPSLLHPTLTWR